MRFSEAAGRKVVSTSTADTVGRIDEFVVDPRARAVVALKLKKTAAGDSLYWSDITAFGADAVTVTGADRIGPANADVVALTGKAHHLLGKRALSTTGDELGKVDDVEFEPDSGEITGLVLSGGRVEGIRLVGVGSYAVVVQAQ